MRAALDRAAAHAAAGDLIEALAGIHAMHGIVYAATGNPEFERALSLDRPALRPRALPLVHGVDRRRWALLPARSDRRPRARRARRVDRDHALAPGAASARSSPRATTRRARDRRGARRRRRRRDRRRLHALPPHAARLERRRAPRGERAHERLDLARGRPLHAVHPELQPDAAAEDARSSSTGRSRPRRASRSTSTSAAASASARPATGCTSSSTCAGSRSASACRSRSSRPSGRSSCSRSRDPTASSPRRTSRPTGTSIPTSLTNALAKGATDGGATILRHTRVTRARAASAAAGR